LQTLARYLGQKAAESFHRQALGIASDEVVPDRQRKSISRETTFETDIRDSAVLRDALRTLASDVARIARREGLSGAVVTLKIRFEGFDTHTRQHKREAPTNDEREILKTAWQLFQSGKLPNKPVRLIGVGISGWEDKRPVQADLFDKPEHAQDKQRLLKTIDAVTEKFGQRMLQLGAGRRAGK
jgi:DNA polymerase-4